MRGVTQFEDNGKSYVFNRDQVQALYKLLESGNKQKKISEIADNAGVSVEAVKSWLKGQNGPSDLSSIKVIAKVLRCKYTELLRECPKEEKMKAEIYVAREDEKRIPRMIYGMMCEFAFFGRERSMFRF